MANRYEQPSQELLESVFKNYELLGSKRATARVLGLPESTVRGWIKKYYYSWAIRKQDYPKLMADESKVYKPIDDPQPRMKILLMDIETSPNVAHVWGLFKANVSLSQLMDSSYTLCFAAKWFGESEIKFASVYHDGEKNMLKQLWDLLNEADAVVHYNGTKFDIPTCNKEFILNKMFPPNPYHQIDLLKVAKDRFRFPSNKLDYVAKALGIGQKVRHIGHELWVRCMANDPESWEEMKDYNIHDVRILEGVYKRMIPWIKNHPNHGLFVDSDRPVCPNCGSAAVNKCGSETTQTLTYQRYRCRTCGTPIRGRYTVNTLAERKNILTQSKL